MIPQSPIPRSVRLQPDVGQRADLPWSRGSRGYSASPWTWAANWYSRKSR